jgi:hypothetical protein
MMGAERLVVRLGIPALLVGSCGGAAAVSWHASASEIPAFAFHSHIVLAVQVTLLFFYAALLLLVPLVRALSDGELPIELSLRGARWREGMHDFGDDLMVRLADAEEKARRADEDRKEEVQLLRQELKEVEEALGEVAGQATKRIDLSVEKVMSRGSRG